MPAEALTAARTARLAGAEAHEEVYDAGAHMVEGKREAEAEAVERHGGDVKAQAMAGHSRADSNEAAAEEAGDGEDDDAGGDEDEREVVKATARVEPFSPSIPGHYSQRNNYPHNKAPEPLSSACPFPWRAD